MNKLVELFTRSTAKGKQHIEASEYKETPKNVFECFYPLLNDQIKLSFVKILPDFASHFSAMWPLTLSQTSPGFYVSAIQVF